jgi:hypothetical protein
MSEETKQQILSSIKQSTDTVRRCTGYAQALRDWRILTRSIKDPNLYIFEQWLKSKNK